MAARANYFKIGLFVVIAFTLAILGMIVLGALTMLEKTVPLVTYLDENVQGLAVGAPVRLRGVQIGRVSEIILAADNRKKIKKSLSAMTPDEVMTQQPIGAGFYAYRVEGDVLLRVAQVTLSAYY